LVGSAGNAPVVASGSFCDTRVTAGQPDHFPVDGSGAGSHTQLNAVMSRASVLWSSSPRWNWWSRRVTLPHGPACRAGALLVCHDPTWSPKYESRSPKQARSSKSESPEPVGWLPRYRDARSSTPTAPGFAIGISVFLRTSDFGLGNLNWQAASVLPRAGWVLETRLRELARGLKLVRLPGIAPG